MTNPLNLFRSLKLCARCIVMMDKLPTSCILGSLHKARPKLLSSQAIVLKHSTHFFSIVFLYTSPLTRLVQLWLFAIVAWNIFTATGCLATEKEDKGRKLTMFLASARSFTIRSQLNPMFRPSLQRLRQLSQSRYPRQSLLVARLKKSHSSTARRNSLATSRR